ncbi:MAG: (d)CMP kinase [Clostridia bacterium]|nr:(d)CMP kinase [Clostridia bacterium]
MLMIVAIDGPAGSGKGTVARMIDERLGFTRIDTGAMYRCIALKMLRNDIALEDEEKIKEILSNTNIELKKENGELYVLLDGEDVSKEIRKPPVNSFVSPVSSIKIIRIKMVDLQRAMKDKAENIVMEGRDITTVVFPDADIKIYLTASLEERARRRYEELKESSVDTTYAEVLESIKARDENDMKKEMGALKVAKDAIVLDNTSVSIEDTFLMVKKIIEEKVRNVGRSN